MPNLTLAHHKLYYTTMGDSSAPPLLLLHGFLGSHQDFAPILALLSKQLYCITPDLPGHDETLTRDGFYTFPSTTQALLSLLDHLKIARTHLLGYSMGGRLALYLACYFPERFERVILESASPGLKTPKERRSRVQKDEAIAHQITTTPLPEFLTQWYSNPLFASLQNHPKAYATMLQRRQQNNPTRLAKALRGLSTGRQPSLWECLPDIAVPLRLITGDLDAKFVNISHRIMAEAPQATHLKVFKNCGHNIHLEDPKEYAQAVIQMLTA